MSNFTKEQLQEQVNDLGERIREVIGEFAATHHIQYATVVGVLRKIEHELMQDWGDDD